GARGTVLPEAPADGFALALAADEERLEATDGAGAELAGCDAVEGVAPPPQPPSASSNTAEMNDDRKVMFGPLPQGSTGSWPPGRALGRHPLGKHPVWPRVVAGVAIRDALQVVLVLRLGLPEWAGRSNLGHHLTRPQSRSIHVRNRVLGSPLLLFRGVEDGRPVAGADVVALTVHRRGVVDLKEELQQVPEGHL